MFMRAAAAMSIVFVVIVPAVAGQARPPATARDVLARSVAAHGGNRLSSWRTMTITGTIDMEDGITYRAAYRVHAKMPDKLKVEEDMTADRGGRYVYEFFLNGRQAWSRRNLIVGKADPARLGRWMNQCFGVAYYATHATAIRLGPEATAEWLTKSPAGYEASERRPAYVLTVTTNGGSADLYVDKATFYLLKEVTAESRRLYSAFRSFSGAIHPTRILEVTKGRGGADVITPIAYDAITYDAPVHDWMFEEDMPGKRGAK